MPRKVRVYEYTTKEYGKGYILAKNEASAYKKVGHLNQGKFFDKLSNSWKTMQISYYDKVIKGKNKYGL